MSSLQTLLGRIIYWGFQCKKRHSDEGSGIVNMKTDNRGASMVSQGEEGDAPTR